MEAESVRRTELAQTVDQARREMEAAEEEANLGLAQWRQTLEQERSAFKLQCAVGEHHPHPHPHRTLTLTQERSAFKLQCAVGSRRTAPRSQRRRRGGTRRSVKVRLGG